jgi:ApaG protein
MINSPRVCVQVQSVYIESQSSPEEERYVFAYTVTIRNLGRTQVQLLGRYWLITNGHGRETEVQGEGVVGEQPHIPAGGEYQYTSGAVIETPLGTMQGHYEMIDVNGAPFPSNPCFPSRSTNAHSLKQCLHTLLATFTVATMN